MTAEVLKGIPRRKFIPLLRAGSWAEAAPTWLTGSYYLDFSTAENGFKAYSDLLTTLLDQRETAPPLGSRLKSQGGPLTDIFSILRDAKPVHLPIGERSSRSAIEQHLKLLRRTLDQLEMPENNFMAKYHAITDEIMELESLLAHHAALRD